MGKLNFTALQVRRTAIAQQRAGKTPKLPCWIDIMETIPPSSVLVRNLPQQHPLTRERMKTLPGKTEPRTVIETRPTRRTKSKKPSRMFQPVKMEFEEDQLRREFYRDHPWELARPRVVLESDGKDHMRYNWESLQQNRKRVDGERYLFTLKLFSSTGQCFPLSTNTINLQCCSETVASSQYGTGHHQGASLRYCSP